jgi:hypothetical protein
LRERAETAVEGTGTKKKDLAAFAAKSLILAEKESPDIEL